MSYFSRPRAAREAARQLKKLRELHETPFGYLVSDPRGEKVFYGTLTEVGEWIKQDDKPRRVALA